jgi:chemotaxis response regulator CheB
MKEKSVSGRRLTKPAKGARLEFPVASVRHSFPVIAMAASVGGLKALSVILGGLPGNFPAAIAIVMHLAPEHKSILAEILNSRTHLAVKQAHTGDVLNRGSVFVAPPNHHLSVVEDGRLKLSSSAAEKIHFARPSAERCLLRWQKYTKGAPLPWCSPVATVTAHSGCRSSRSGAAQSSRKTDPRRRISACRRLPSRPVTLILSCL